jgi:hypothetical protein
MNTKSTAAPPEEAKVRILVGIPKLELGKIVATPGALACLGKHGVDPLHLVLWHQQGQWGALDREDVAANQSALKDGSRIFSSYIIGGEKVWIITEAVDEDGSRNSTAILLPSEY